ncbi:MAG: tetratricopeptide repeat protein, partial [Thermoanaerobaculia bacterium]|nr:tetratricopeptide repeat protein [Thermoanaerobaculia bacterium]
MKKIAFALLLLFPLLAGAQALDTLAAKKSLDSLIRVSALHYVAGRYTAAREASKLIIALAEQLHSRQSGEAAFGLNNLALAEMNLGDLDLAILYMEEALAIRLSIFDRKHAMVGATLNTLGVLYTRVGRLAEAEACLLEFKAGLEERLGANHPDIRYALINLAKLYEAMGQYRNAEDCLLKVKDVWAAANGRENAHYALIINELGNLMLSLGRFDKAEQYFLEVKNIQEKVLKPDHPDYAICLNNLGSFYNATGHYGEA